MQLDGPKKPIIDRLNEFKNKYGPLDAAGMALLSIELRQALQDSAGGPMLTGSGAEIGRKIIEVLQLLIDTCELALKTNAEALSKSPLDGVGFEA